MQGRESPCWFADVANGSREVFPRVRIASGHSTRRAIPLPTQELFRRALEPSW